MCGDALQDVTAAKQHLLQGHVHNIGCLCTTPDRSLVLTADANKIIAWDTANGTPAFVLEQPHAAGTACMDISDDGQQLATVSMAEQGNGPQEITVWNIAAQPPLAVTTTAVPAGDPQERLATLCCAHWPSVWQEAWHRFALYPATTKSAVAAVAGIQPVHGLAQAMQLIRVTTSMPSQ